MKIDKILKCRNIYPGRGDKTFDGAVAIAEDKIVAVGTAQEIAALNDGNAEVVDYGDNMLLPGLIDAHAHIFMGAISASNHMCTEIFNSTSAENCLEIVKKYMEENPNEERVRGNGWFLANWTDKTLPTKKALDELVPDKPCYLDNADGHTFWLNSKALEECGFYPGQKFNNGSLGVDENGELDGLVYEIDPGKIATKFLLQFDDETMKEIIGEFMDHMVSKGITCVSEMCGDPCEPESYHKYMNLVDMDNEGKLKGRINYYTALYDPSGFDEALRYKREISSEKVKMCGVKGFIDGVTSTYTGYMLEPYADNPDTCGIDCPLISPEDTDKFTTMANAAGLPVRYHCVGDAAVRQALDACEASVKANGPLPFMNAVEHIENIDPADLPRFKELGVMASFQCAHLPMDVNEKIVRCGEERCRYEWAFRSAIDAGAEFPMSTDYPVVDVDPFPNIYAGITRNNLDGTPAGVDNGENITMAEALEGYTYYAAKSYGQEDVLGTLEAGKYADITVLDRNLFEISNDDILSTQVLMTMVAGKTVFQK